MHIDPPTGYSTWLDYAVAATDVRAAQQSMNGLCEDDLIVEPLPSYDEIRAAAAEELSALRVVR